MGCCCQNCARWLIGTVSICVIICAVVAGVTVYVKEKDRDWSKLIKNNIPFIFILIAMACAIVSSIIGFLLCCCKSMYLYFTYLTIIIIVIVIEIIAIVLAFCFKDNIIDGIEENWQKEKYKETRFDIENNSKCCEFKTQDVPPFICGYNSPITAPLCYNKINKEIDKNAKDLRISTIVMGAIELILFVCALYLVWTSEKDD